MRHRERITTLYIGQNKTLKDVMAIMEDKHDFVATERMYKARFKEWSVGKNVTAAAVHKLMAKVEQHQKCGPYMDGDCKTIELDVGNDLDVKRIQKYMKRKPVGLKKLRADPNRPLDVIKALSVDNGKGRLGRAKVSILPTVKREYQQTQAQLQMSSPPSDLAMPWSPPESRMVEDGLPDEMTLLMQAAVDQEFNMPYPFTGSPLPVSPTPPSPWPSGMHTGQGHLLASVIPPPVDKFQAPDQLMLDFVLKFRIAHILLDDGLTVQAFEVVNMCLNILSTRLQQTQGSDSRASCTVILYALTAALEMTTCFDHLDVVHMLFQHINIVCAGQQPRMAEIARRTLQLGRVQQISMLKLARTMMSRAAVGYFERENPGYELYSRTVDVAISHGSADEKLQELQAYLADPIVQSIPYMAIWMEERISLAMCDAPPLANQTQSFWTGHTPIAGGFPMWTQGDKTMAVLKYSSDRIDCHKVAGNWATATRCAGDFAWLAEMVRGYDDEMSRKFRADMDSVKSPMLSQSTDTDVESDGEATPVSGPIGLSLPSMHTLHASMSMPEMRGFKQETNRPGSTPSWDHHTHDQIHDTALPSLWIATGGVMDGMNGMGLYDGPSSF